MVRNTNMGERGQISAAMGEIGSHAAQAFSKAVSDVAHGGLNKYLDEEHMRLAATKIEARVRQAPWQTVGIALVIGVFVGLALREAGEL